MLFIEIAERLRDEHDVPWQKITVHQVKRPVTE
jgi:hypothetical protein